MKKKTFTQRHINGIHIYNRLTYCYGNCTLCQTNRHSISMYVCVCVCVALFIYLFKVAINQFAESRCTNLHSTDVSNIHTFLDATNAQMPNFDSLCRIIRDGGKH